MGALSGRIQTGPQREKNHDDLQLSAQAMCLEEMTGKSLRMARFIITVRGKRREVELRQIARRGGRVRPGDSSHAGGLAVPASGE